MVKRKKITTLELKSLKEKNQRLHSYSNHQLIKSFLIQNIYAWVTVLVRSERFPVPCNTIWSCWSVPAITQKKCRNIIMQLLCTPQFTKPKPQNAVAFMLVLHCKELWSTHNKLCGTVHDCWRWSEQIWKLSLYKDIPINWSCNTRFHFTSVGPLSNTRNLNIYL